MWHNSDICKEQQQIEIFRIWGSYSGTYVAIFWDIAPLWFCMGLKLGLQHWGKIIDWGWEWRKLHNEESHYLYSSPSTISMIDWRMMRWTGHVARMGRGRRHVRCRWGSQKERALGRPWRMWVDNIKLDLRQDGMIWIGLMWFRIGTAGGFLWTR
jgi:hypothetical protein